MKSIRSIGVLLYFARSCVAVIYSCFMFFFFFKQKTAYEMRISDWSSDVCSSDLMARSDEGACMFLVDLPNPAIRTVRVIDTIDSSMPGGHAEVDTVDLRVPADQMLGASGEGFSYAQIQIGRAACRERVGQYGEILVGSELLKKKKKVKKTK